jgi:glycosyltransferase involved in cell wall biosynthesis
MRVIGISHLYFPKHFSGAEVSLHTILKFLQSKGHEVRMIVSHHLRGTESYEYDGIKVYGRVVGNIHQLQWGDVILSQLHTTANNILEAYKAQRPLVHFLHNNDSNYTEKIRGAWGRNYVVYNAESNKNNWHFEQPSMILHPPVLFDEYSIEDKVKGTFITLINLNKNKGVEIFYKIAERLPSLNFLGIPGSYDQQILPTLPNVKLVESFLDMREIYPLIKILLMPSEHESWGRTATEAMCSGIPVICTDLPGLRENCGDAGIYIKDRNDIDEWVNQINKLQHNLNYSNRSKRCIARAKELDATIPLNELESFLYKIVRKQI